MSLKAKECVMGKVSLRLLVGDFPKMMAFWRDAVGLSVGYCDEAAGYAYGELGGMGLELFARDAFAATIGQPVPASAPVGQRAMIELEVDDVDATYAALLGQGGAAVAPPEDRPAWGVRAAHVADPDGTLIELYTRLPADSAPTA